VLSPADIAQPHPFAYARPSEYRCPHGRGSRLRPFGAARSPQDGRRVGVRLLIIATGSTHSYFGRDDWAKLAPGLKTIEDATEIRRRVLLAFELAERQMMESGTHSSLNFVIVGGGPTGVELAGAISDIAKLYMAKDFRHIDPSMAQVLILEGSPKYPRRLSAGPAAQGGRTA